MLESEKITLLGLNVSNNSDNTIDFEQQTVPITKMQSYLTGIHDSCYHMLGSGCHTIGRDFYQIPGLANALINSVFYNMEVYVKQLRKKY